MKTRTRRTAAALAAAAVTTLALAGCTSSPDVVQGSDRGSPGGNPVQPTAPTGDPAQLNQPLTAADLPGWVDADLPDVSAGLVQPCGSPTGLRDLQADVKAAALTTPTGITVVNQTATYSQANLGQVIDENLATALVSCPGYLVEGGEVSVIPLGLDDGKTWLGTQVTRVEDGTGLRDVTVYLIDQSGTGGTVEVAVSARMGADGGVDITPFAHDVLTAAKNKALGAKVGTVSAPAIPPALSLQDLEARAAEQAGRNAQVPTDGIPEDQLLPEDQALQNETVDPGSAPPAPDRTHPIQNGVEGEGGPGAQTGSIDPETYEMP